MHFLLKAMFWEVSNTWRYPFPYFGSQNVCSLQLVYITKSCRQISEMWWHINQPFIQCPFKITSRVRIYSQAEFMLFLSFLFKLYNSAVFYRLIFKVLRTALMIRGGWGGTPIHYLYGYVLPNGVVILRLLI